MFGWMRVGYCCFLKEIFWRDVGYVGGGALRQEVLYELATFV